MYKVKQDKDKIELAYKTHTKAVINIKNQGGRLESLVFNNNCIIKDLEDKPYEESFSGAILFPFANRICEGKYQFQNKNYNLSCNEAKRENAIHGLIYNKNFELKSLKETTDYAETVLMFEENNPPAGFPFPYKIELTYLLYDTKLSLKVTITNTGQQAFPYTLGWHPYFYCDDFENSFLSFSSHKMVIMNHNMIALGTNERVVDDPFSLKNKTLDDCFVLNGREIEFYTKDYKIRLEGHPKSNFFQIYTPPNQNSIALEPMTGVSDSFNHKKGLQVLQPKMHKSETWSISYLC